MTAPTGDIEALQVSLHDVPVPVNGLFVSATTGELTATDDDFLEIWKWFRARLNREPLGPEIFHTARRLYHAGRYDAAAVMLLLFRGGHSEVRVKGGGTGDPEVTHLWAHLLWKIGRSRDALDVLSKLLSQAEKGSQHFEDCWQLLVELGVEASTEAADSGTLGETSKGEGGKSSGLHKEFETETAVSKDF